MDILNEERNIKIVCAIVVIILGVGLLYITREDLKKEYYKKGREAGLENAEYYCHEFDQDYLGSLKWIEIHDPKLFNDIRSRETDYNDEFPLGI